jgi:diadenosine tetraphosphate (Ap4A) HIT family hydrolase
VSVECNACAGRWPARALWIADRDATQAYLHEDQFFPGWTVVVLRRHVTELYGLAAAERALVMDEVSDTAAALARAFGAVKMNYALLGNVLPHMHWHLIPRRADDPAPLLPVWGVAHAPREPGDAERAELIARIRAALAAG